MANYPTSLDSFTNPSSVDSLSAPSHSQQHSDANDAIEALEAKVGIGTATAGSATAGHVLVASAGGTTTWTTVGASAINTTGGSAGQYLSAGTAGVAQWATVTTTPTNIMAKASNTTNQTGITTVTDLTGLSVTFTGVAGRQYKVNVMLPQISGTAGERAYVAITDASNNALYIVYCGIVTNGMPVSISYYTTATGSTTFKVRAARDIGSNSISFYGDATSIKQIWVEDIGVA